MYNIFRKGNKTHIILEEKASIIFTNRINTIHIKLQWAKPWFQRMFELYNKYHNNISILLIYYSILTHIQGNTKNKNFV